MQNHHQTHDWCLPANFALTTFGYNSKLTASLQPAISKLTHPNLSVFGHVFAASRGGTVNFDVCVDSHPRSPVSWPFTGCLFSRSMIWLMRWLVTRRLSWVQWGRLLRVSKTQVTHESSHVLRTYIKTEGGVASSYNLHFAFEIWFITYLY